ncbi:MAG: hypothetical protein NC299_11815 [Lachnospiraceae bacterium]|nr:hypothetical protein [Lachnospiraceae bacterium]
MNEYERELSADELAPPKPYSAERRAEIDELNAEISALYKDICEMGV